MSRLDIVDMTIPIPPDALMLVISDMHPWHEPDSNERYGQFIQKINAYCRYVAEDEFESKHPGVPPTNVVISFLSTVPPSARMRQVRVVQYEKRGTNIPITISFADEAKPSSDSEPGSPTDATSFVARTPAKRRLLIRGWIVAAIGAVPIFATLLALPQEPMNPLASTIMGVCFWAGVLTLVVGFGMVLWSQQEW